MRWSVPRHCELGDATQLALVAAINGVGSDSHVDRLIDLIASLVPHDLVTVVRYSVTERPEFVSHRNYSEEMIKRYLAVYYPYDPFYRQWREGQEPGVVRLQAAAPVQYVTEFLGQSVITDELGVLLEDASAKLTCRGWTRSSPSLRRCMRWTRGHAARASAAPSKPLPRARRRGCRRASPHTTDCGPN